jgi:hypothetical protein
MSAIAISHFAIALLLVAVLAMVGGTSFSFFAIPNDAKCFTEELSTNRYLLSYKMRSGLSQVSSLTVTGEKDSVKLYTKSPLSTQDSVALAPAHAGVYTICFKSDRRANSISPDHMLVDYEIELESIAVEKNRRHYAAAPGNGAGENPSIAQAEYIERSAKTMEDWVQYFRGREQMLRETNEVTNTRIILATVLTILAVVVVGVLWQARLQQFLVKKKIMD